MSDATPLMLGVTAAALLLVSYMLYLRLGAEGASPWRIVRTIAELWLTFAFIVAAFATARHLLGPGEPLELLTRARALPATAQAAVFGLLLIAALLFAHLLVTLRPPARRVDPEEDHHA